MLQLCNNPVQILLDIHTECSNIHLLIGAICLQYSHVDLLISRILIVLLDLKLQYSYICHCAVCALREVGHSYLCYWINKGTLSDIIQGWIMQN